MNEELKNILSRVDHTLLAQGATWNEIKAICDDGIKYGCASVCIPASYVKQAAAYVDGKIAVCTVIGFPNGYDHRRQVLRGCRRGEKRCVRGGHGHQHRLGEGRPVRQGAG